MRLNLQYFGGRGSAGGKGSGGGQSSAKSSGKTYTVKELSSMSTKEQAKALDSMPTGTVVYLRPGSANVNTKYTKMESGKWALNSWEDVPKSHQSSSNLVNGLVANIRTSNSRLRPEQIKSPEKINFYRVNRPKK